MTDSWAMISFTKQQRISPKDIDAVQEEIAKNGGYDAVIITNYQYF
ncbi:hypothetical protein P8881_18900 [Bacillus haynesii]|nr:hypothetical protein [Bacillus haynesii]